MNRGILITASDEYDIADDPGSRDLKKRNGTQLKSRRFASECKQTEQAASPEIVKRIRHKKIPEKDQARNKSSCKIHQDAAPSISVLGNCDDNENEQQQKSA